MYSADAAVDVILSLSGPAALRQLNLAAQANDRTDSGIRSVNLRPAATNGGTGSNSKRVGTITLVNRGQKRMYTKNDYVSVILTVYS